MSIDLNRIDDDTLYNTKETCDLINIKNTHYLIPLRKKHGIKYIQNGKFTYYKGSEIKKLIQKRLSK